MSYEAELKSYRFRSEREREWLELERLLGVIQRRGVKGLESDELLQLPKLYRSAVSSLSTARAVSLDRNLIDYLETLCTQAYLFIYGPRTTFWRRVQQFFAHDWPMAVRKAGWATLLSALCLFGGALIAFLLVMNDMDWFYAFQMGAGDSRNPDATTEALRATLYSEDYELDDSLSVFASFLFTNNTMVSLLAFALGFALGIPTVLLIVYNGFILGAFVGLFVSRGLGFEVIGWLAIHGVTELFAIVLAGAAGFLLGGTLAFPGDRRRIDAMAEAGKQAGTIGMGVVVMLVLAALLEGFGRQLINSDIIRYTIAGTTLLFWLGYFYLFNRRSAP
ncbi:stage II sporulation protein M [Ponticaulis profundi]|uniref:Stage II sporulation protein M n=1 Tax=Ponticaulis profundi TaxID=2665222 RepID=A0ABW1S595_9PROT